MTNMESLYGSGKFTEIMQSVKLTAIKKITAEEVEFYTSKERFDIHGQLRKFMKGKNILKERKTHRLGGAFVEPNSCELLWTSPTLSPIRHRQKANTQILHLIYEKHL